jgi:hypothetical protein
LLYLVCMLSIIVLPYAVHLTVAYRDMMEQKLFVPFKQLPPFSVRDGEVYFYSPMPYEVKNEKNEVVAIIDTEGKINQLPYFLYPEVTLLITKNALHLRLPILNLFKEHNIPEGKETVVAFSSMEDSNLVGIDWLESSPLKPVINTLSASIYPILLMFYTTLYTIILFSFGLFGQFVARFIFKVNLTLKESVRVMIVASTPQAMIYFILLAFKQIYPGTGIVNLALLIIYFSLGVLAYRWDNRAMILGANRAP